ncbi:putative toxin-antitoxin system toxin component, PIN family [Candidatus Pacearchaeota archaeon]|nr:putative toxin-antitoxin system toxin component, PIN family [Candidatus Pacearchaeota archaeon]
MMRIVADTNIFISGIFWEGNFSSKVISLWRNRKIDLISSVPIIEELVSNLKGFKIKMDEETVQEWENMILENAVLVEPEEKIDIVKDDSDDNKFIEAAVTGKASYIVTQDNHLLKIKEFRGIKILTPKEFLNEINKQKNPPM